MTEPEQSTGMERKKRARRYYFRVIDKPHQLVFMVNLLNKDNP